MKTDSRRLDDVLPGLAGLKVACLHGADAEAIRLAARRLVVAAAGSVDDPFRVSECDGDAREAIEAALGSPCLAQGRTVVWVRHAGERLAGVVAQVLAAPLGPLLVLECPGATARSRLRAALEQSEAGCAIACALQPAATRAAIRAELQALDVEAPDTAVQALAEAADAAGCPGAITGLAAALYAGAGGCLAMADVARVGDAPGLGGLEQGMIDALGGDAPSLDRAVAHVFAEGASSISVLRQALLAVQRLRGIAAEAAETGSVSLAIRGLRYPGFFGKDQALGAVLRTWSADRLDALARALWDAERTAKATGVPQEALCRDALLRIAATAVSRPARVPSVLPSV